MKETLTYDLYRFNASRGLLSLIMTILRQQDFRYVFYLRWYQSGYLRFFSWLLLKHISNRMCMSVGWRTKIGKGLRIIHGGCIAINNEAIIGDNCTLYHGVTIGMEFRGKRLGNPTIGSEVWIGANATLVGNIKVGDDVLIAPGAFVNFDIPSHSVVLGNPGKIFSKENATKGYIDI